MGRPPGTPGGTAERPALFFADAAEFRAWLAANHASAPDLWMGLYKKHVPDRGLTWADAVPEALCFGWIDSQVQRIDADAVRQRWTPRRPGSIWSAVNVGLVEQLSAEGRMQPAGLAAFARRNADRPPVYTHEQGELVLPPEFAAELAAERARGPVLRRGHAVLPQGRRQLGGVGGTTGHPRPADGPADRRLRARPAHPVPALRTRAALGRARPPGPGLGR